MADYPRGLRWAETIAGRSTRSFDLFEAQPDELQVHADGAYILIARRRVAGASASFVYPLGRSQVYYIGLTTRGQNRLAVHRREAVYARKVLDERSGELPWRLHQRYNYAAAFGARVCWFSIQGRETARQLEAKLLDDFYWSFGALPVANGSWTAYIKNVSTTSSPRACEAKRTSTD